RIAPEPAVAGERARAEELVRGSCRTGDAGGAWSSAGGRLGRLSGRGQGGAGGAWSSAGGRLGRLSGREQVTQAGRGAPPAGGWAARQGMGRPQRPRFSFSGGAWPSSNHGTHSWPAPGQVLGASRSQKGRQQPGSLGSHSLASAGSRQ